MSKHIVILGGGFGGLYAMFSLRRHMHGIPYTVTLVNDKEYFAFTPFLSEVVGKVIPPRDASAMIKDLVKKKHETFVQGTVEHVDLQNKTISLHDHGPLSYDYLVIAFGSTTNFLHVPGAMEHSFVLKNVDDATLLKERIDGMLLEAASTDDIPKRHWLLTFIIVGGGATSLEIVGDVEEHICREMREKYPHLSPNDANVKLITGGAEIAKDFDPELRKKAAELIMKEHIELVLNARVKEVMEDGVRLTNDSCLYAHTIVWVAGVRANSLSVTPDSVIDPDNQKFCVDAYLQLPDFPNVFAIGDIATSREDPKQFPMLAQAAVTEGLRVGANIARTEQNKKLLPFVYHSKGELVTIGKGAGIASVFGIDISGKLAWFLWKIIYLYKYIDHRKKPEILYYWFIELLH